MSPTRKQTLCAVWTAGILAIVAAPDADAFDLLTKGGACPSGFVYPSDQSLTINLTFVAPANVFPFTDAVIDVAERVSQVGGQSFDYLTPFAVSNGGYAPNGPMNVFQNGVNEVGQAALGAGIAGMGAALVDLATCQTLEADVFLATGTNWLWGTPDQYGDDYFGAQNGTFVNGVWGRYGRPAILHELGHTLSLAHTLTGYSFMNATTWPWSNRASENQIEFLPDDRNALRVLYGNGVAETDLAALVTWFDTTVPVNGAAVGKLLCQPTGGTAFSPGIFDPTCGVDAAGAAGSTTVCPGDTLYTRYTAANYSTVALNVDAELWFSENSWLNMTAGADQLSPTAPATFNLVGNVASRRGVGFQVPLSVAYDTEYYPILHLNTGASLAGEESQQNNWIPLVGKIRIDTQANCP
jgi:hypothetical protein